MLEIFWNFTLWLASIIDVMAQFFGATPWEWAWIKVKALLNIVSFIVWTWLLIWAVVVVVEKQILWPKKWIEPNWSLQDIWWVSLLVFWAICSFTPLWGYIFGWFIIDLIK